MRIDAAISPCLSLTVNVTVLMFLTYRDMGDGKTMVQADKTDSSAFPFKIGMKHSRLQKTILAFSVGFIITGCSQMSLFYDYADWYIMYRVDGYFDITDPQEDFLNPRVDALHAWHRVEEVPKIILFLKQIKLEVKNGFNKTNLPWIEAEYAKMRHRINQKITDDVSLFLASLNTQQIEHFKEKLAESNIRHLKRGERQSKLTSAEWKAEQHQKIIAQLEDWYGDFTAEQVSKVTARVRLYKTDWRKRIARREKIQAKIISLLRQKKSSQEIRTFISSWFMNPGIFNSTTHEKERAKRNSDWMDYWISLNEILTPAQQQHAQDKLQDYIDELEEIQS